MKIIEAMKQIKDLTRKAEDLRRLIQGHSVDLDLLDPVYEDQEGQVSKWLQAHTDIVQEILHLKVSIQITNSATDVAIVLGDKTVTKTIAEWIHRRRSLAQMDKNAWESLGKAERDGRLKEGTVQAVTPDAPNREVKIRRYYDPKTRDRMLDLYRSEPTLIDGALEVVNAVTDLVV